MAKYGKNQAFLQFVTKKLSKHGCKSASDWITEAASFSSTTDDIVNLFKYRMAGIREYWIISPMKKLYKLTILKVRKILNCFFR